MKIQLEVIEGPHKGKTFVFTEPDCFLVGRDAPGCHAHFRLEKGKDMYVSRNHFLLEIRPPNCFIRDNQSTNGTYLKKSGDVDFKRITTAQLHDGDLIRIGNTIFKVSIVEEKQAVSPEVFLCIRCGADVTDSIRDRDVSELSMTDYLCSKCKKLKVAPSLQKKYRCLNCERDVSNKADKDGRAEELSDVALYLCEDCASEEQETVDTIRIKDYRILKELGRGGMGVVYKVWHEPTGRLAALKKILPEASMDEKAHKLFQREMVVMSLLVHKNIVRLYDLGMVGREHYFVSEFMPDGDVDKLITREYKGPLPVKLACEIISQALEGLDFAHRHPKVFVHRDIKPQNILLNKRKTGQVIAKISDFGLAKSSSEAGKSGITKPGQMAGTLLFMAPEQFVNYRFVKPPADVYSMGVTLYYLLTARYPFDFPTPLELLMGMIKGQKPRDPVLIVLEDPPIPIRERNPDIPGKLAKVVDKAISKDERERFQSAGEFKEAIEKAIK